MTWIVFVSLGLLTSRFCRAKWTNRLAFIGSMAMILLFLIARWRASKNLFKFCPNWQNKTSQYLYFVGARLSDYIYITQ
jgi:hypothetical protein